MKIPKLFYPSIFIKNQNFKKHMNLQEVLKNLDVKLLRKEVMNEFMTKYHIDGLPFDAVIHHFTGCNPNEDFHDHPWNFTSFILKGWYQEQIVNKIFPYNSKYIMRVDETSHFVYEETIHKLVMVSSGGCWTLVLPQRKSREPGFYRIENGQLLHRFWNEENFKPI